MIDLELRRRCISSTDVGPIFGVDAYRGAFEVWTEKHGHAPPFEPTPRMLLGKDLEQGIVKAYSRITGRQTHWADKTVLHRERAWMAASPDALVLHSGKPRPDWPWYVERGVDAKLVFYDQRRKWGTHADAIPEGIQLQMWWMMAVLECDVWDIAAWVGEDEPRIYEIERNPEAERVVIAKCEEWHRRYVLGDEIPPISGSKAAGVWLQQAFPHQYIADRTARPDIRDATEEEIALLEEYTQVRLLRQDSKEQCEKMENQIKLAIAEREGLEWPGGTFTWRKTKDKDEIDWESLGKGLLNEKDAETRKTLLGIYTSTKAGIRKMRFVSNAADVSDAA